MALTLRTGGGLLSPASAVNSNKNTRGNNGGLIGGVGYLAEKSALGFLSSVEGIWDYSAGGVAKLFGVDKWAERQFANDWVNYTHADEWYDPGKGWQIAGDVAGGIGTSMPAIAGAAGAALITYFSGGTAAPAAAKLLSASVAPLIAGFGAAGSATKEAYQKTGNLGAKEFGYGALSGATEAAIEGVTAGIGTGTGRIVSALSKKAAGETVQTLSKSGAKSVIKHLAADFASEAVEEGLAEAIDPLYQKLTIDPNAKAATAQEIGYAALVGGLSGLVMSGGAATVNTIANLSSGNAAINSGNAEKIIKTASSISAYEDANDTGYESYKAISADYKALSDSLKKTGGQITTAKQRMLLGSLKKAETAAFVEPFIERSAENLLLHADSAAERFSAFGMTDADGKEIHVTADEIRSGVDADLIRKADSGKLTEAEQKTFTKQVRAAMRSNSVLTTLATMDATGRITMDARKFAEAAREGADIATAADINAFAETASQEEIRDLAADLGISDWAALTPDEFREKTAAFAQSDRGRELSYQSRRIRAAMGLAEDSAVELPKAFRGDIAEGATRYRTADGIDMAIIREGDRNYIYNYASGNISRAMSEADVNKILADYWSGNKKAADDARLALSRSEVQNNVRNNAGSVRNNVGSLRNNADLLGVAATARYNMLAAENIKGWRQLSEPVKQAVRMTMRQAEAAGLSEDTAITFGRVAAHSGMNIVFDSIRSGAGDALQTGNTIYIDPGADKSRIEKRLLIHEMAHALIKGANGWTLLQDAFRSADPTKAQKISKQYISYYKHLGMDAAQYMPIVNEEIAVSHLEDLLGSDGVWDYMLADEPSLGEKVLNFFRGSARDYADDAGLSAESRKLLTMYRKMFRELSEKRRGGNALELAEQAKMAGDSESKRFAFAGDKAKTADKMKLDTAKKMIQDGKDSESVRRETGWFKGYDGKWRFEIDDSGSKYFRSGDALFSQNHPEYTEHSDLTMKFINGDITDDELARLNQLGQIWGGEKSRLSKNVRGGTAKLEHMIQHDSLFAAYPQLRDVRVLVKDMDYGKNGTYLESKNTIEINSKLSAEEARKALLHEIQHAVQSIEGFTSGGNLESNRAAVEEVMNIMELTEQQRKMASLDLLAKYSDMVKRPIHDKLLALAQKNGFNTVKEYINSLGDYSYYERIAGEVEARDVARRSDMDSEQRKNTRPDIDREDVVFAETLSEIYSIGESSDGKPVVVVNDDITKYAANDKELIGLVKKSIGSRPYIAISKQKIHFVNDTKREVTFSKYTKWLRANYPNVYRDKMRLFNHPSDIILATTNYINEGLKHSRKDNIIDFARGEILIDVLGNQYRAEVVIGFTNKGICELHDVVNMAHTKFKYKTSDALSTISQKSEHLQKRSSLVEDIVLQNEPKVNSKSKKSSDERLALPEDSKYLDAVNRGDMETAQKMVDEAAKNAGYTIKAYHGTTEKFTAFDKSKIGQNYLGYSVGGFYFTTDKRNADYYSGKWENGNYIENPQNTISAFLNLGNAKETTIDSEYFYNGAEWLDADPYARVEEPLETYDSVVVHHKKGDTIVVKDPEQIKSADPVTYDDNGNVIPLSERFNADNNDIRYALPEDSKYLDAVNRGDMETAQKMVDEAAKEAGVLIDSETNQPLHLYHGGNADITVFDGKKGINGKLANRSITYFSPYREVANNYKGKGSNRAIYDCYLVLNNPLVIKSNDYTKVASLNDDKVHELELQGYDGVIFYPDERSLASGWMTRDNTEYVAFKSAQIKSADPVTYDDNGNIIPLSERFNADNNDIRYALPEEGEKKKKYHMSHGQLRADVANKTRKKAYSKADARATLEGFTGAELLSQKVQNELADYLWQGFNTCETKEQREKFSKNFAQELGKRLFAVTQESPDADLYRERITYLGAGIGRLMISSGAYAGDFQHRLDKDGYRRFRARWSFGAHAGKKGFRPYPVDQFVNDIAGEMPGMEYLREMHPADAMLEIDKLYTEAKAGAKERESMYSQEEADAVMSRFEEAIMQAFEERGHLSVFQKRVGYLLEQYADMAEEAKAKYDEINGRNEILGRISAIAKKMKDLKLGTFKNSTQMESEVFIGAVKELAKIEYRGNLSVKKAKTALRELAKWYRQDTSALMYVDEQNSGYYNAGVAEMLNDLTADDEPFTKEQLMTLHDVLSYFTKFAENYGKIWRADKWVEAKPIAERYVQTLLDNEKIGLSLIDRLMRTKYLKNFGDPASVVRQMDRYQRGFYTEIYEELRAAAEEADVLRMNVMTDYDAFMKKNPKYIRDVVKQQVVWTEAGRTNAMPKMTAISLYMTSKREQAQAGLALNGFKFKDADGKVTSTAGAIIRNPDDPRKVTQAEISQAMTELQNRLKKQFSAEDLAYIKILEKAYGYDLRSLKAERDMQKMGFTNATLDYYYPIRRANIAKSIDVSAFAELDRVSNASFNKNTVQGARGKLFIEDADALFQRHATAVTRYAALSPAIENFNILFNMDISGNPNDSVSVATVGESQWEDAKNYFRDLIGDIQGVPKNTGEYSKELSALRSHVAMSQLGANPKTWVTQLSSLFAASSRLDPASIMQGMRYGTKDVDIYCDLAKLRNYDAAAIKAQGVLDRVSHAGEVLMKPIAATDRLVVCSLWGACQVQVQKNQNLKLGTDENKVAAGKLLTEVLLETQQNSLATEKSSMMRSGNEILRALTMFSADGMKVTGRYLDGLGEVSALKQRIKAMGGTADDATKEALKQATKRMQKALAAMVSSAVFSVLIAEGFRLLYAKEREEDESAFADMLLDFTGNMLGGLPGLRDVYTFMVDGYELDNYAISAVNDLLSSVKSSFGLAFDLARGEGDPAEIPAKVKSLSYATGQFTGIPVRNIYNLLTGLTRRFSPVAGYQIDRVFYSKNYRNDLREAVEAGDTRMVAMLTGIIHGKDASGEIGDEGMTELNRLAMAGANVMPRTIGKKITVDGEEVELDREQQSAITESYEDAWSAGLAELMKSDSYAKMTDEQREDAIRKVHDISYERALLDGGFDRGERSVILTSAVGLSKAAVYYATVSGMAADVDRKGNKIEGSRRTKTVAAIEAMTNVREERLLLLTAAGYSLQAGDFRFATAEDAKRRLLRYIVNMKGVSAEEKAAIAQMCGFEVKNGKISAKSLIA